MDENDDETRKLSGPAGEEHDAGAGRGGAATRVEGDPEIEGDVDAGPPTAGPATEPPRGATRNAGPAVFGVRVRLREMLGSPDAAFADRYEQDEVLGQGGMGEVVLARDLRARRSVALKRARLSSRPSSERVLRFASEAQLQAGLEHPSIVPVYDLGLDPDGRPFFTMKRVRGMDLERILKTRALGGEAFRAEYSRTRLLAALSQVCLTLEYAHSKGVVHRDLKPANLMLGEYGEIYVLDWGLALRLDEPEDPATFELWAEAHADRIEPGGSGSGERLTEPGSGLGTPGYAAPEQVTGDDVGPEADVWALGSILFEVLAEEKYLPDGSTGDMLKATLQERDRRPSSRRPDEEVPPELDALCERALSRDPGERLASAREMHEALRRFLEGDRDLELRRREAVRVAAEAAEATAEALSLETADALQARSRAMKAIAKSLALDPDQPAPLRSLVALLETPPAFVPPEVDAELERSYREEGRRMSRTVAAASAGGLVVATVGFAVLDVLQPAVAALIWVLSALSVGFGLKGSREAGGRFVDLAVLTTIAALMYVTMSRVLGPLVFVPTFVATAAVIAGLHYDRRHRWLFAGVLLSALWIPHLAELAGWFPASYLFEGGGVRILPQLLRFERLPVLILLPTALTFSIVGGIVTTSSVRDQLLSEERRRALLGWQLRQMVPAPEPGGEG